MNLKKLIKTHGSHLSVLCAIVAFFLFIPACTATETLWKVFFTVLVVLLLLCGGLLLFFWNRTREARVHFFLYDRESGKNRPDEELTPQTVSDCISFYLAPYGVEAADLFADIPRPLRQQLEREPDFRPVVMYQMLHALSGLEEGEITERFQAADPRAVAYLCRALSEAGDGELADFIYRLKKNAASEERHIPPFFKRNAARFEQRAMKYIDRNFEKFYVQRSRFK